MKGIILAGGSGSRMYPISQVYSKQLTLIYDKPLIYYPLSVLMLGGIKEILIISNEETIPSYQKLFKDGSNLGLSIEYVVQSAPNGIAEAFILGDKFIGNDSVTLILGDNIFYGNLDFFYKGIKNNSGATVFGYRVNDPERYGVVEFDKDGKALSIEEKPQNPKSKFAVPGLYIYNNEVVNISKNLKPSSRGELEITDVNTTYLTKGKLRVEKIGRGLAWLDTGTPESLLQASNFFGTIEDRQGLKVACIEEIAYYMHFISKEQFKEVIQLMPKCQYKNYLENILADAE
ncbi:MAG: glucose-1-phosphate thymidylyltransferase [Ignavibacteria bacterium CG_4_8_14_3_um_filter_37_9]|nr:glucose-1-phosphate thymidylyltransferase RfbA [Ignavibacteria bacterium]OIO23085.1 MAG: glucose-1-phosphate thymidylyltransferase [Ignavibacteria bacterium CG1_02_37_35]PIW99605.1 MAG: glucose-1-phosphate thymidylyltransferase [Ignavibacteria bacterium CG_4_8_14_3_um_filter_37_9]PIX94703.1 MAG: glucose-1-phosphate thymidylyltransferase [Ignavibacteria bacterium CG_4_10_14_3_um_filter_37_18]PJC57023.1 MAG: glucose-1-phosphate thymidylyltransferase [Ignavibacteria bacterium CG_4_9_14_0_2_um_f